MEHERSAGGADARRYSREQKDQAVRLVRQVRAETGEHHGAVQRVAAQLGYGVGSVRSWVSQADINVGQAAGTTTDEAERFKKLEEEVKELRRATEILRWAATFFAAELDRPQK